MPDPNRADTAAAGGAGRGARAGVGGQLAAWISVGLRSASDACASPEPVRAWGDAAASGDVLVEPVEHALLGELARHRLAVVARAFLLREARERRAGHERGELGGLTAENCSPSESVMYSGVVICPATSVTSYLATSSSTAE